MRGNEPADDADVGFEDGGVDVDVEVVQIVDDHVRHSPKFRVVAHHDQRVQGVDQSQLKQGKSWKVKERGVEAY